MTDSGWFWSGRRDSNPRRPAWEAGILPLNYSRSIYIGHLLLGLYSTPQTGSQSTAPSKVILRLSWGFAGRMPLAACCRSRLSAAGRRPSTLRPSTLMLGAQQGRGTAAALYAIISCFALSDQRTNSRARKIRPPQPARFQLSSPSESTGYPESLVPGACYSDASRSLHEHATFQVQVSP